MGMIQVRNMSVGDFLLYQKERRIPDYKLRYTWNERDTEVLIKDINEASSSASYSIGVAVYVRGECIDGLGRLITLSLIAKSLDLDYPEINRRWTAHELKALKNNYLAVKRALSFSDQSVFRSFFCDCTYITLVELDEMKDCFSFFDAGSERGVSLDPADLLKAYHLCSMRDRNEGEKLSAIAEWEAAGRESIASLFRIWHPLLYWSRGIAASPFSFQALAVFEGIDESSDYPFARVLRSSGYSLLSPVLNGKPFFDRFFYYHRMKRELDEAVEEVYPELNMKVSPDSPAELSCYDLFKSLSLLMIDRFGLDSFKKSIPVLFKYAFALRLEDSSVPWDKLNRYVLSSESILFPLMYSLSPYDIYSYDFNGKLGAMRNIAFRLHGPARPIDWDHDFDRWLK